MAQINEYEAEIRSITDQLDALYKRVQKLEHKSPVPLYEEKMVDTMNVYTGDKGTRKVILISGKDIDGYSQYYLAKIIQRLAEQLEGVWNQ